MTREEFKDITGEWPEDILGNDWENEISELTEEKDFQCPSNNCGNPITLDDDVCFDCK